MGSDKRGTCGLKKCFFVNYKFFQQKNQIDALNSIFPATISPHRPLITVSLKTQGVLEVSQCSTPSQSFGLQSYLLKSLRRNQPQTKYEPAENSKSIGHLKAKPPVPTNLRRQNKQAGTLS